MTLKSQLRHYLKSKGLNASQLAKAANVPRQSISDWLGGTQPRNIAHVKSVATTLGITMDNLLFGSGDESPAHSSLQAESQADDWMGGFFEVKFRRIKK